MACRQPNRRQDARQLSDQGGPAPGFRLPPGLHPPPPQGLPTLLPQAGLLDSSGQPSSSQPYSHVPDQGGPSPAFRPPPGLHPPPPSGLRIPLPPAGPLDRSGQPDSQHHSHGLDQGGPPPGIRPAPGLPLPPSLPPGLPQPPLGLPTPPTPGLPTTPPPSLPPPPPPVLRQGASAAGQGPTLPSDLLQGPAPVTLTVSAETDEDNWEQTADPTHRAPSAPQGSAQADSRGRKGYTRDWMLCLQDQPQCQLPPTHFDGAADLTALGWRSQIGLTQVPLPPPSPPEKVYEQSAVLPLPCPCLRCG